MHTTLRRVVRVKTSYVDRMSACLLCSYLPFKLAVAVVCMLSLYKFSSSYIYAIGKGGQGLKDGDISAICLIPGYFFKFYSFKLLKRSNKRKPDYVG